jgi:dipeptidase E
VNRADARIAVIDNARDYSTDLERKKQSLKNDLDDIRSLGFLPEHVDLRNYFNDNDALLEKLREFDAVWVLGGNSFILRKAMKLSGFDAVINELIRKNKLVYAGYSAALCVISLTMDGVELVDDIDATAEGYSTETIWDGYGLIDFYPIVHYKSDHPESKLVDKELEYVKSKNRKYKTLRDGDTIVIETDG